LLLVSFATSSRDGADQLPDPQVLGLRFIALEPNSSRGFSRIGAYQLQRGRRGMVHCEEMTLSVAEVVVADASAQRPQFVDYFFPQRIVPPLRHIVDFLE
jgi:hypothetical protein